MKRMILFALAAGAVVALGQLTAAQWHAIGAALLALLVAYRVSLLPWLLALFFALLWLRQRSTASELELIATEALRSAGRSLAIVRSAYRPAPAKRKRATR